MSDPMPMRTAKRSRKSFQRVLLGILANYLQT